MKERNKLSARLATCLLVLCTVFLCSSVQAAEVRLDSTATVCFTFMYIQSGDHEQVFRELSRVISPGGRLLIWDAIFPERKDPKKDVAIFPLRVQLPGKTIETGYGVSWPPQGQGLPHYAELAERTGFKTITQSEKNGWFFLELQKQGEPARRGEKSK